MSEDPTDGYCERELNNMNSISNQVLCPRGSDRDIAFHYRVDFSVKEDSTYEFLLPIDFGRGGFTVVDGKVEAETRDDSFGDDALNVILPLKRGAHVLEVLGAEDCCDGYKPRSPARLPP